MSDNTNCRYRVLCGADDCSECGLIAFDRDMLNKMDLESIEVEEI